ncbi:MAG: histidine--tRNA ligase [Planctomycetota bacterium]|jgi:histidyl-tRNA synthetase
MAKDKKKFSTAKGTRDYMPEDMRVRRHVINTIRETFESFGYGELDTPAFEPFEMLAEKSGEEVENQIYAFDDKGGRRLGLRFEFTASLARVIAGNPNLRMPFRRYQIGKVWRYEAPQAGRHREFYQADVDIVGSESMACEAELIAIFNKVCEKLKLKDYHAIINHRKILAGQLREIGIPSEKHAPVMRVLDKWLKIGVYWVREELVAAGFEKEADGIVKYFKEQIELNKKYSLAELAEQKDWLKDPEARTAVDEILSIFEHAESSGVPEKVIIYDPMLVRGLDYYTGPIFEFQILEEDNYWTMRMELDSEGEKNFISEEKKKKTIGSFGGGGRYDNLVEAFGGQPKPATGFAFGVDRLIHVYSEQHGEKAAIPPANVYIIPENSEAVGPAMKLGTLIRQKSKAQTKDIKVLVAIEPKKAKKEFQFAAKEGFPNTIFQTVEEAVEKKAQLRKMQASGESKPEVLPWDKIAEIIIADKPEK